jgi:electron transport complex protein RnfD
MNNLTVSVSPHVRSSATTQSVMSDVALALLPAFIASIVIFGGRSFTVVFACVVSALLSEFLFEHFMKKPVTLNDFSAIITGCLLGLNLPVGIPIWQAILGSAVAIILVKQLFGGLGKNFANPAITARIVLLLAFSTTMSTWVHPDAVSSATPLVLMGKGELSSLPSLPNLFLGVHGGSLGETSVLALLIGGVYLIIRKVISWHTPVVFIATVFFFTLAIKQDFYFALCQTLSGGLFLGAIFMATDYVTTPQTAWGRVIFGIGAGFFTVVIRLYGSYPEGVSFAILLMNILTPYINKATMKKPLGGVKV